VIPGTSLASLPYVAETGHIEIVPTASFDALGAQNAHDAHGWAVHDHSNGFMIS
jgi:hypothetical protein